MLYETCDVLMTVDVVFRTKDKHYHSPTGFQAFLEHVFCFFESLIVKIQTYQYLQLLNVCHS
jgi:hypothetical protein